MIRSMMSYSNQCDYFGWFGWFNPLDFLANPLDFSNFGRIGWILAVLAGFVPWTSFPIHWNILKIITLTAIAYKVENALKSPKTYKYEVETRWHGATLGGRRAGHGRVRSPPCAYPSQPVCLEAHLFDTEAVDVKKTLKQMRPGNVSTNLQVSRPMWAGDLCLAF